MLGQNEIDSEEDSEGAVKGKRKRGADDLDFDDFDEGAGRSGEWRGLGAGPTGLDRGKRRGSRGGRGNF